MTAVEDLEVGDWFAIHTDRMANPFRPARVSGRPLQITAINLPFLAVSDGTEVGSVDVREFDLIKLSADYVLAMNPESKPDVSFPVKPQEPDSSVCPRCGSSLVLTGRHNGSMQYTLECSQCDHREEATLKNDC